MQRGGSWRALVYHEVAHTPAPAGAAAHASPADFDTSNPCRSLPYTPRNAAEKALIDSWQMPERAVAGKGDDWAPHVADEFIVVGNQRIQTKAERRAAVNKGGAAPPPLVSAQMFEFGDTIVMTCRHQPHGGRKPTPVSRVFIKGEPWWPDGDQLSDHDPGGGAGLITRRLRPGRFPARLDSACPGDAPNLTRGGCRFADRDLRHARKPDNAGAQRKRHDLPT